jgi:hypothetical protein
MTAAPRRASPRLTGRAAIVGHASANL